jgi:hypothetical protein
MKVLKYKFNGMIDDIFFLLEEEIVEKFTQTAIDFRVHTFDKFDFFFIGSDEDHLEMISIFKNSKDIQDILGKFEVSTEDVTKEVLSNIDKFENLKNYCSDNNVLLKFYESNVDSDFILDKIGELGIESLTERDKEILQRA